MKNIGISATLAILVTAGCVKEPSAPVSFEAFPLRATVTPDNHCTVEAWGRTYTSIGQVRGAVLPTFSGTLESDGYHAIGCWVSHSDGTDGELVVTFSGNSYQLPFPTGSFRPVLDPPYGSTEKIVSVSFSASFLPTVKLRTVDESSGAVTVESDATGARTIRVDVTALRWEL